MNATSENQETAAYRYELVSQYLDIANQKMWFGWGLNQWPRVFGMPSIDNFYLLLFLMHGIIACSVFVTMVFSMMIRLVAHGMRQPVSGLPGSSLAFTLASILLAYLIAVATVYMGMQTVPLLFMAAGWGESYLMLRIPDAARFAGDVKASWSRYRFRCVVADDPAVAWQHRQSWVARQEGPSATSMPTTAARRSR